MKILQTALCALALAGLTASAALETTPSRHQLITRSDGSTETLTFKTRSVPKLGDSKFDNSDGHDLREVPTDGELRACVILIEFEGQPFSISDDPKSLFSRMLNEPGFSEYGATGSVFDYYHTISSGQFSPKFDVYGPVKVSKRHYDYADYNIGETYVKDGKEQAVYGAGRALEEAIAQLDDQIDFSQYDSNGDGMVDFVYAFHAGQGATTGGGTGRTIWPHAYTLEAAIGHPLTADGLVVNRYVMSCELKIENKNSALMGAGMFCHEFGHILGLPDLYDTANNNGTSSTCFTPGPFSNMDGGNYNNNAHTSPTFSGYERYAMEWMLPTTLDGEAEITLLPLTTRNLAYKVNTLNPYEWFILEARAPHDNDFYIPGHGLAVWHIDFNLDIWQGNTVNNTASRQRIDLVEADNDLTTATRDGDLFPGATGIHEYVSYSQPTFLDWNKRKLDIELSHIVSHPDGTVTFSAESPKKAEGFDLKAPQPRVESVDGTAADIAWPQVEGAESYIISVYDLGSLEGGYYRSFLDGYRFRDLGASCHARVEGLQPGVGYGVTVYAISPKNASRSEQPLALGAIDPEFEKAVTNVYAHAASEGTLLSWDKVTDATHYLLTVASRSAGETAETATADFADKKLPEGWASDCTFTTNTKYCGAAAPALTFGLHGQNMTTALYDRQINSLSMFVKVSSAEEGVALDVYGTDADGRQRFVTRLTDLTRAGSTLTVDLPADIHALTLRDATSVTDVKIYVDDMVLSLADGWNDTPVSGYDGRRVEGTSLAVTGLENEKEYVAYVRPVKSETEGRLSASLPFTPAKAATGVGETAADLDANLPADVYTLTGILVATLTEAEARASLPAGIYILRQGAAARKIVK